MWGNNFCHIFFSAVLIVITCVTFTIGDKEDAEITLPDPIPLPVTFTMSYSFGFAIFSAMIAAASGGLMIFELLSSKHMIPMWTVLNWIQSNMVNSALRLTRTNSLWPTRHTLLTSCVKMYSCFIMLDNSDKL